MVYDIAAQQFLTVLCAISVVHLLLICIYFMVDCILAEH